MSPSPRFLAHPVDRGIADSIVRRAIKGANPLFEALLAENGVQSGQQVKLGGVVRGVGGKTVEVGV